MFDAASPLGHPRRPLPPAQSPLDAVPGPRTPTRAQERRPATDRPGGKREGKQRDAFFDNAKYLAIVLVAMGHFWSPLMSHSRVLEGVYRVVYTFHMPAFIIISGFFSRSFDMRPDRLKRLLTGVAVPYVVFETAYQLFKNAVDHTHDDISLLDPWYLTWFLAALFVWRLTAPVWRVVRWPLPVAVGIAMLASVTPSIGKDLDLQRVLQFLPYFVLGLCMKPEHFRLMGRPWVRIAAVPVAAVALGFGWWSVPRLDSGWFYRQDSAQELGAPWWCGPVMVLAMLGCTLLLTACFFAWVPRRRTWFTALGAGTLYGYLLHGFLVKYSDFQGWFDRPALHRPLGEAAVTLFAAATITLLCTKPVQRVFRFVMEPRMEWAFRQDATELAIERRGQERERERAKADA
ncbi:acyltransferase family protein [Streptomyces sp. NK08204]|uniref:acyltransferase family protein n=1 Tax=Streptomyces sp. NK08204 TaxID=2873260 RepID=UPI001CEC38FC|nr:acyltransferase family protein [Streptomyces sp. NK08204]